MKTRVVEITEGATGRKVKATLIVCPNCGHEKFMAYVPETVNHIHYQCARCGVSYCDGCTDEKPEVGDAGK